MPTHKSRYGPECGCTQASLIKKEVVKEEKDDISGVIIRKTWSQGYCEKHKFYGGKPAHYRELKYNPNTYDESNTLSFEETEVIRYILGKTFGSGAIAEINLVNAIINKEIVPDEQVARKLLRDLISKSILIGENSNKIKPLWRYNVNASELEFFSELLDVRPKETRFESWISLIDTSTAIEPISQSQLTLREILIQQKEKLLNDDPGFLETSNKIIIPNNAIYQRPVYEIILRALCKWLVIWKPVLTIRELSARSVKDIALNYGIDPSKLLEKYWLRIKNIFEFQGFPSPESLGLIKSLEFLTYSGCIHSESPEVMVDNDPRLFKTISNYALLSNPNTCLSTPAINVLCTENLAAFFYISQAFRKEGNVDWLIIYKGGYNDFFVVSTLHNILVNNEFGQIVFWFDNDYGGIDMFNRLIGRLQNLNVDLAQNPALRFIYLVPPAFYGDMFDKDQGIQLQKLSERANCPLVNKVCEYIREYGSIEQEVFLSNYQEFFTYNSVFL